jgi:hypothetical protein
MNLKLLCLLFDPSLTVQQTDTCRGSSAPLKFQSYSRFQPTFVSSPYFCVLIPTLVGENCRRSETTASLLGFLTCRSTNRFWLRELCYVEVGCLPLFSSSGLVFQPTTVSSYWNWWRKFSYLLKLLYPLLHSPLAEPQTGFYRESSGMSKFDDCSCFFFSNQVWLFCLLQCFAGAIGERKFQSIWNYYTPSCIPHWQIHK